MFFALQIEQSFALSAVRYVVKYKDDEGEIMDIVSDDDLYEAIEYFSEGSDVSSNVSSVESFSSSSGSSEGRVLMRVFIEMEYDGPSLSETMSLRSTRDSMRFGSQASLPYFAKSETEAASFMGQSHFAVAPILFIHEKIFQRPAHRLERF